MMFVYLSVYFFIFFYVGLTDSDTKKLDYINKSVFILFSQHFDENYTFT